MTADRRRLLAAPRAGAVSLRLFELLPVMPRFTIDQVRQKLETTFPTATAAVKLLEDQGIVTELTGQKKNRSFSIPGLRRAAVALTNPMVLFRPRVAPRAQILLDLLQHRPQFAGQAQRHRRRQDVDTIRCRRRETIGL